MSDTEEHWRLAGTEPGPESESQVQSRKTELAQRGAHALFHARGPSCLASWLSVTVCPGKERGLEF